MLPKPKTRVIVREMLDGRIKLLYQTMELAYVELEKLPHKEELATRSACVKRGHCNRVLTIFGISHDNMTLSPSSLP